MLTVNTNVISLNAQRNLSGAGKALSKSLERLSSGLRINRASDDAAGLAISEGLRSQVRGLNQAVRNANDGISLLSTAESAVVETTNMLQRMRELAVQSANDVNSTANRTALQDEVDQLSAELTRIGDTIQFNGQKLLDGTFQNKKLQVGAAANETISISIGDLRGSSLGSIAEVTGGPGTATLAAGDVTINGVDVGITVDDGVSSISGTFSSIAMATAINSKTAQTGVTAEVNATAVTGGPSTAGTLNGTNNISINGVQIGSAANTIDVLAADADGALRDAINAVSNTTGVTASLDTSNNLVLTAEDGRNIQVTAAGTGAALSGAAAAVTVGTYDLYSDEAFTIGGATVASAGLTAGSVTVDANTAVNTIDVTTSAGAANAIIRIDHALRQVSAGRSEIGAKVNRLESTISNLMTVSENLAASESRIRDADFAAETALLTRAQILQQAGTAILAQANVTPQAALSLLG